MNKVSYPKFDIFTLVNFNGAILFFVIIKGTDDVPIIMLIELITTIVKGICGVAPWIKAE
jgi:hypothetical protein